MTLGLFISSVLAPALFWSGYLYYKDRFQPEPLLKFGSAYLAGIAAALVCLLALRLLPLIGVPDDPSALMETGGWPFLAHSLAVTGFVEELFKFLPFILIVVRYRCFDEKTDGIIYASAIALGFASFENMRALVLLSGWELYGRAFASPLTHTMFASIWGYLVGIARLKQKRLWGPSILGLILAATAHGVFNFLATSSKLRLGAALFILVIWIWQIRKLEKSPSTGKRSGPASPIK